MPGAQAFAALHLHASTSVPAEIEAITGDGAEVTLPRAAVQELSDSLRGRLLLPGTAGYDDARSVLSAEYDRHPALIVQPTGAADVQSCLLYTSPSPRD